MRLHLALALLAAGALLLLAQPVLERTSGLPPRRPPPTVIGFGAELAPPWDMVRVLVSHPEVETVLANPELTVRLVQLSRQSTPPSHLMLLCLLPVRHMDTKTRVGR